MIRMRARGTPDPDEQIERMERIVRERVASERSTGIAAGMLLPGGRMHVVACGDAGQGRPLDERSLLEIGSITKVFTGTLLAEMAQRGELMLTDPVATLLPPGVSLPTRAGRQITLLDLATQTSGLPRLPANLQPADDANPYADYTVDAMYEFLRSYVLQRDPGAKYEYSNLGVGLLGHVLALRAQACYEELVQQRLLQPLGMTSTAITIPPGMAHRLACGHDGTGSIVAHWDLPTLAGAGALRSSIGDMLRFAEANLGDDGSPLQRAMAAAHAPRRRIGFGMRIGLSWHILGYRAATTLMHDGGTGGFSSFIGLQPAKGTAAVVLSNSSAETVSDIGLHLIHKRMRLSPPPKQRTAITLPAAVLERYAGVYEMAGARVEITRSCDGLSAKVAGAGTYRLYAEAENEFFTRTIDAQVVFKVASDGTPTGAVLHQAGQKTPIRTVP